MVFHSMNFMGWQNGRGSTSTTIVLPTKKKSKFELNAIFIKIYLEKKEKE